MTWCPGRGVGYRVAAGYHVRQYENYHYVIKRANISRRTTLVMFLSGGNNVLDNQTYVIWTVTDDVREKKWQCLTVTFLSASYLNNYWKKY